MEVWRMHQLKYCSKDINNEETGLKEWVFTLIRKRKKRFPQRLLKQAYFQRISILQYCWHFCIALDALCGRQFSSVTIAQLLYSLSTAAWHFLMSLYLYRLLEVGKKYNIKKWRNLEGKLTCMITTVLENPNWRCNSDHNW